MRKIWLVLANASLLKIYEVTRNSNVALALLEERYHPESRLKGSELISDAPGSYQAGNAHGGYEAKTQPKDNEAQHFAREVVSLIQEGLNEHQFEGLVISAPPAFEGVLKKILSKSLLEHVKHFIGKDYTALTLKEVESQLGEFYRPLLGKL